MSYGKLFALLFRGKMSTGSVGAVGQGSVEGLCDAQDSIVCNSEGGAVDWFPKVATSRLTPGEFSVQSFRLMRSSTPLSIPSSNTSICCV